MVITSSLTPFSLGSIPDGYQLHDEALDVGDAEQFANEIEAAPVDLAAHEVPGVEGDLAGIGRGAWRKRQRQAAEPGPEFFATSYIAALWPL